MRASIKVTSNVEWHFIVSKFNTSVVVDQDLVIMRFICIFEINKNRVVDPMFVGSCDVCSFEDTK